MQSEINQLKAQKKKSYTNAETKTSPEQLQGQVSLCVNSLKFVHSYTDQFLHKLTVYCSIQVENRLTFATVVRTLDAKQKPKCMVLFKNIFLFPVVTYVFQN